MKPLYMTIAAVLMVSNAQAENASKYITQAAHKYRVSESFAMRVAKHESGLNCHAVGRRGEVGPLQILPSTARAIGYRNIRHASCRVKVDAGMKYLARCYHGAKGNQRRAAACHNAGEGSLKWRRYPASVNKYVRMVTR